MFNGLLEIEDDIETMDIVVENSDPNQLITIIESGLLMSQGLGTFTMEESYVILKSLDKLKKITQWKEESHQTQNT